MSSAPESSSSSARLLLAAALIALAVSVFVIAFVGIVLTGDEEHNEPAQDQTQPTPQADPSSVPTSQPTQESQQPEEEPYPYEQPIVPPPSNETEAGDVLTNGGITLAAAQLVCERHLEQAAPYGSVIRWGTGSLEPMIVRNGEAWRLESMITTEGAFENSGADYSMVCVVSGVSGNAEVESFEIR